MIEIQNRGDCSGCAACAAACPRQAIEMNADQEGFLYPVINSAKCIDCGICDNMCQAKNMIKGNVNRWHMHVGIRTILSECVQVLVEYSMCWQNS